MRDECDLVCAAINRNALLAGSDGRTCGRWRVAARSLTCSVPPMRDGGPRPPGAKRSAVFYKELNMVRYRDTRYPELVGANIKAEHRGALEKLSERYQLSISALVRLCIEKGLPRSGVGKPQNLLKPSGIKRRRKK